MYLLMGTMAGLALAGSDSGDTATTNLADTGLCAGDPGLGGDASSNLHKRLQRHQLSVRAEVKSSDLVTAGLHNIQITLVKLEILEIFRQTGDTTLQVGDEIYQHYFEAGSWGADVAPLVGSEAVVFLDSPDDITTSTGVTYTMWGVGTDQTTISHGRESTLVKQEYATFDRSMTTNGWYALGTPVTTWVFIREEPTHTDSNGRTVMSETSAERGVPWSESLSIIRCAAAEL